MKFEVTEIEIINNDQTENAEDFWITANIGISEINGYGSEVFYVNIVGCERLRKVYNDEPVIGRGIIFMRAFDNYEVKKIINRLIEKSNAKDWNTLISNLSKYFDFL